MLNTRPQNRGIAALVLIISCALTSFGHNVFAESQSSQVPVSASKARMPSIPAVSRTAAVYLTLHNQSKQAVVLTGVETSAAAHSMIHQTIEEDGLSKMRHADELTIAPGSSLAFKPGGLHIMLMGVDHGKTAEPFIILLNFKKSPSLEVLVTPEKLEKG